MMKNIRINESDVVSLIKNIITEMSQDKIDLQSQILTYNGNNQELSLFRQILLGGGELNDIQIETAKELLGLSVEKKPITKITYDRIRNDLSAIQLIMKRGKETYELIKNSDKKYLFNTNEYTFAFPSEDWVKENLYFLEVLESKLSDSILQKKIKTTFGKDTLELSVEQWIELLEESLVNKSTNFVSILKKEGENLKWTELPKIDTNYLNWGLGITKLDSENKLGNGSDLEKIEKFFSQQSVRSVVDKNDTKTISHIIKVQNEKNLKYPLMSFAEYELLKDALNNYEGAIKRISKTTQDGNIEEDNFIGSLKILTKWSESTPKKKISNDDIINFSTPGNQVDMFFGIDLIVLLIDKNDVERWIPIQVKSNEITAKKAKLLNFRIGGISVFREEEEWLYIDTPSGRAKNFAEDFLFSK